MMSTLLQEKARELLDRNEVSLVIGYGEFFRRANDKSLQQIISPLLKVAIGLNTIDLSKSPLQFVRVAP